MAYGWMERASAANNAVANKLADASDALADTLREANAAVTRQGAAGLELARGFSDDLLVNARRAGTRTRGLIAERPVESVLIFALTGVAIGWLLRRTREARAAVPPTRARSRSTATRRKRPA